MSEKAKRKPDWSVCVKGEEPGAKWRTVGAAWETEKGNLYVRLDQGERLEGAAMLFPYEERSWGPKRFWNGASADAPPVARPAPQRSAPPIAPPTSESTAPDYMEWKRQCASRASSTPSAPANDAIGIENPDVEPPGWL